MKEYRISEIADLPVRRTAVSWIIGGQEINSFPPASNNVLLFTASASTAPFSSLGMLFRKMMESQAALISCVAKEHAEGLGVTYPEIVGKEQAEPEVFPTIQAVTRRISRETAQLSMAIDETASFTARSLRLLSVDKLVCFQADNLDAATLRVLTRLSVFLEKRDLEIEFHFDINPFEREGNAGPGEPFTEARRKLFAASATRLRPQLIIQGNPDFPGNGAEEREVEVTNGSFERYLSEISSSLAYQTYDRVYHLCDQALSFPLSGNQLAEIHRLQALVDVNLGDITSALGSLEKAKRVADSFTLQAHLHYLFGLILTKRQYDLEPAESSFNCGIQVLDRNAPDTSQAMIERAWLLNGMALVQCLKAKEANATPDDSRFGGALHLLKSALLLIRDLDNSQATYLRFNLLANAAFLFEIMDRYAGAISFWEQAFLPFLSQSQGTEKLRLQRALHYRSGLLYYRAGKVDQAGVELLKSARAADMLNDTYASTRIIYGTGIVLLKSGDKVEAANAFERGAVMARAAHDWEALHDHLFGLTATFREPLSQQVGTDTIRTMKHVCDLYDNLRGRPSGAAWSEAARRNFSPPRPSPKLPAYNPLVDLAAIPKIDLNRYLESPNGSFRLQRNQ